MQQPTKQLMVMAIVLMLVADSSSSQIRQSHQWFDFGFGLESKAMLAPNLYQMPQKDLDLIG